MNWTGFFQYVQFMINCGIKNKNMLGSWNDRIPNGRDYLYCVYGISVFYILFFVIISYWDFKYFTGYTARYWMEGTPRFVFSAQMPSKLLSHHELIVYTAVALALAAWFHWRWKHRHFMELAAKLPGPPSYPLIGTTSMFTHTYDGKEFRTVPLGVVPKARRPDVFVHFNLCLQRP